MLKALPYIAVMAAVTYLIRMLPMTLMRKKIRSRFFLAFLAYLPYSVLGALTFPAIFYSTGSTGSAACGCAAAVVLAYFRMPLIVVALAASAVAFTASLLGL